MEQRKRQRVSGKRGPLRNTYQGLGKGTHYGEQQAVEPVVARDIGGYHIAGMYAEHRDTSLLPALGEEEFHVNQTILSPDFGLPLTWASSWANRTLHSLALL